MKYFKYLLLLIFFFFNKTYSQVIFNYNEQGSRAGVNTTSPKSTFDVQNNTDSNGKSYTSDPVGLQAPRITLKEIVDKGSSVYGSDQKGALVFITDVFGATASGQTANINEAGYYFFDGSKWQKISSSGSQNNAGNNGMRVGETRATVVVVDNGPNGLFKVGSTSTNKVWMNNRGLLNTQNVNYKLLSEVAPLSNFLFFGPNDAFRMDFASGSYQGAQYYAPKFVNTSSKNMFYSLLADSPNVNNNSVGCWIKPGAVCWGIDGNDGFSISVNNQGEYNTAYILIHNIETGGASYYQGFWSFMMANDELGHDNIYAIFSITRLY
jgi:hypothetical protein